MRIIILSTVIFLLAIQVTYAKTLQEGLALYNMGNFSSAEIVFRDIVARDPGDYTAKYMLAITLVNKKQYSEARGLYHKIITGSSSDRLVSLSQMGLKNLGETSGIKQTKAVLNINMAGGVMIVNDVILNDSIKTKFVLDTGATFTTISRAIASKLNISTRDAKSIKIMTGSGYINAPLVKIPEIEVNGLNIRDVDAIVTDLPMHGTGKGSDLAGLLGLSFLQNFTVTVDRANNTVVLEKNR